MTEMRLNMKNFDFKAQGVWRNGESWRMEEFLEDGRAVLVYIEKSCAKFAKKIKKIEINTINEKVQSNFIIPIPSLLCFPLLWEYSSQMNNHKS